MLDWGSGSYETTAGRDLAPVSEFVASDALIGPSDRVVDLACGTGNAALLAARRTERVIGVDRSRRLLDVAAARAQEQGLEIEWRDGDLAALPVENASADIVLSVFGLIFAADPAVALREVRRILAPGGRVLITAWQPRGPIVEMIGALTRLVTPQDAPAMPAPFRWDEPATLGPVAEQAGLELADTLERQLAFRAETPEAYVEASQQHPIYVALAPRIAAGGLEAAARDTQLDVLRAANENPHGFLAHSPYVLHTLQATAPAA